MFDIGNLRRFATLGLAFAACLATGCGGGTGSSAVMRTSVARTQIKIGDAPADSVLAFALTVTRVDLMQQGGTSVNVLNTSKEVELTHLSGTVESLAVANVGAATYTGAAITVSNVEVSYLPSGSTSPVEKKFALNTTINVAFNPAITISNQATVLNFDLNVAQSLTFDAAGNVTAVNPVFTASTAMVAAQGEQEEETGKVEDMVGVVSMVTPASGNTPASFALTPDSGGVDQTFTVDANTKFEDGLTQFSDLKTGMLVKVDATTQTDGSLLATDVEMKEATNGLEADGVITATTGNPVTSLTLLVQDEAGNMATNMVGTPLTVDVSNAAFKSPLNDADLSSLLQGLPFTPKFDNTTVATGQRVEVNGAAAGQTTASFSANKVTLRQQALTGTVGAPGTGSNASFSLLLDADSAFANLTKVSSLNVYEVSKTQLKGISSVTQGTKVRVRGLLLFDGTTYQFVAARITQP
jgi:Domain of unknown function (DUF5666)/Domain of unknown function (DUF4382)